jgi:hypothetical protein
MIYNDAFLKKYYIERNQSRRTDNNVVYYSTPFSLYTIHSMAAGASASIEFKTFLNVVFG